jgi:hypothetical protein
MENFLQFLSKSSGDRVFWYGLVFLIAVYIIVEGIVEIFKIFKKK